MLESSLLFRQNARRAPEKFTGSLLIYCLREQRQIVLKMPHGSPRPLRRHKGEDLGAVLQLRAPYGIAVEEEAESLWVADKHANAIWNVAFTPDLSGTSVFPGKRYNLPGIYGPCMLDYHADYGLLVGCYGVSSEQGAVLLFRDQNWSVATPLEFRGQVTHCCWLPDGGFCYVTRDESILWRQQAPALPPEPLTLSGKARVLASEAGTLSRLRLRYVQGLCYSAHRRAVLIADASLGAIFELDLEMGEYRRVAGRPLLSDSTSRANVQPGDPYVWLGPIRGITDDSEGRLVWLDGESGQLFRLTAEGIESLGGGLPGNSRGRVLGCGLTRIPTTMEKVLSHG